MTLVEKTEKQQLGGNSVNVGKCRGKFPNTTIIVLRDREASASVKQEQAIKGSRAIHKQELSEITN